MCPVKKLTLILRASVCLIVHHFRLYFLIINNFVDCTLYIYIYFLIPNNFFIATTSINRSIDFLFSAFRIRGLLKVLDQTKLDSPELESEETRCERFLRNLHL